MQDDENKVTAEFSYIPGWLRQPDVATPDVHALTARVERLEAALRFYADEANWRSTIEYTPEFILNGKPRRDAYRKEAPVVMDQGKEARAALGDATEGGRDGP